MIARWKSKLKQSPSNEWVVFELCKALNDSGMFGGVTELEKLSMVELAGKECGANRKAIFQGWQEFCSLRESA